MVVNQSHAKQKRYHQHESQQWLTFAEGILDNQFEPLQVLVFEKLDSIIQASSLGCSSATTLIMNGLEFRGQELSKRPDMIGQSSGHAGGLVAPLGLDQS